MKPLVDPPRLESSTITVMGANDPSVGLLMLETDDGLVQILVDESSARDLIYELQVFLGEEE
ncbi:hypothetical protein [Mesorhizobium sp. ESP-6-2]|uniref:hypothetical protein n=1 Tax=Mesorhizobium sp. ESP-6-2 TaxID=2876625 RepID=UPI001CCF9138|nr:hypothetical protein [Mesorhizobium sp. ESP-6-2]MBZ9807662.1 hypothetical protein [Mesorhizobium sp. ESP-6-2]